MVRKPIMNGVSKRCFSGRAPRKGCKSRLCHAGTRWSLTEATPGKPSRRDHGAAWWYTYGAQWGDTPHGSVELTPYTSVNGHTKISDSGKGLIVNLPQLMFLVSANNNQPFSFTYCFNKLTSPLCSFLFTDKKARRWYRSEQKSTTVLFSCFNN